jgi:hypothetical protein
MRFKTYLSLAEQWDRSVDLYLRWGRYAKRTERALEDGTRLARIVIPHRLFVPGDLVLVELINGGGERQQVYCVSTKGFSIRGMYLGYGTSRVRWRQVAPRGAKPSWKKVEAMARRVARPGERLIATAGNRAMFAAYFDSGPLRFVELPESLVGQLPDSPDVRRFVVENLAREECRTPGKRE